jgi:hypothetical protein
MKILLVNVYNHAYAPQYEGPLRKNTAMSRESIVHATMLSAGSGRRCGHCRRR